jgi:hypothetical protein
MLAGAETILSAFMLNQFLKKECVAMLALGVGNDPGAASEPPSKPVWPHTFFAPFSWRRKGIMVALLVDSLGKVRPRCFARSLLFQAADSVDRGNALKAALELREAANRYLVALCQAHNCWPKGKQCTPAKMNSALRRKLGSNHGGHRWLADIIVLGNAAAHCKPFSVDQLKTGVGLMHIMLDRSPELCEGGLRGEQPKFGWMSDDDDEGEGWKAVTI